MLLPLTPISANIASEGTSSFSLSSLLNSGFPQHLFFNPKSKIGNLKFSSLAFYIFTFALFDDFIRPVQHRLRNRQADLLRRFQVDDQLKLHRLLHGKVGGFGAL